ncbi:MAG TPA: tetratricopeptide repeat protein, partial [Desulfuromonadaceae bacterium]
MSRVRRGVARSLLWAILAVGMALPARADFTAGMAAYQEGDYALALREFVADGSPEALFYLGRMYEKGEGVRQDRQEAERYYRQAADAGFVAEPADDDAGGMRAQLVRSGAERGYPKSETKLGLMYLEGDGVAQDKRHGAALLMKAADQGYAEAQYVLYHLYSAGDGVERDPQKART